jgi:hypothetical protein
MKKTAENTALLFDRSWLCRYPRPMPVIHDTGTEFGQEFASIEIQEVTTMVQNPRANAKLERVHEVIGDMLRTYDFENQKLDTFGKDCQGPFDGFLFSVAFTCRATYQTSIGTSPASMVFQRDMFFPTQFVANWKSQAQNRKAQLARGVERENSKRLSHCYRIGDRVSIRHDMDGQPRPKIKSPTSGPFDITRVIGVTLEIKGGCYLESGEN